MMKKISSLFAMLVMFSASYAQAQDIIDPDVSTDALPTLFSVKTSAGWGIGRSRQLYGYNGSSEVWWSTGEGVKLNLAIDLPIIPVDVVDSLGATGGITPVVGLELEAATGYHLSTGGTTNDAVSNSIFQTTKRTTAYIPVTLGLNARSSFGGGLPSVYIGAGGGVFLVGIYEEAVTNSATNQSYTRKMHPPIPFGLYGALGFEVPLAYDPDAGNSSFDLFAELRLTEMSAYVYDYDVQQSSGATTRQSTLYDPGLLFNREYQRSASSVAFSLGFKFNLF